MGKSILVPGGNFKSLRSGMISSLIPKRLNGLSNLWLSEKFMDTKVLNAVNEVDLITPPNILNRTYSNPTIQVSAVLKNKPALSFTRGGSAIGTYLEAVVSPSFDFSITFVFNSISNSGGQVLFSLSNDSEF